MSTAFDLVIPPSERRPKAQLTFRRAESWGRIPPPSLMGEGEAATRLFGLGILLRK